MEPLQYFTGHNSRLKGSSAEKIYEELDLESFIPRHWYRKMSFLYKVLKSNHRHTFLILYQIVMRNVKQKIQATLSLSLLNMIILRVFFLLQQLSGIN